MKGKTTLREKIAILITILAVIVAIILGRYAYSMYVSTFNANATAQVARWNFELIDGDSDTENGINFPITRTDNNTGVATDRLAPETYGCFEMEIDTSRN